MRDAETNRKRKSNEGKKAFWAMGCEAQPAGRQGSVLTYVTEPNKGCNKADRRPKHFFLEGSANKNSNQQRNNSVQFREHRQNHRTAEQVVSGADAVDTVGADFRLTDSGKESHAT